jgi:hypothetical protein
VIGGFFARSGSFVSLVPTARDPCHDLLNGGLNMAADALTVRIAHLDGAYEQVDKRLGSLEGRMASLSARPMMALTA